MGKISPRTIGYALVMGLIVVAVAFLMAKVARTELASRRLLTIAGVIVLAIIVGGLGMLRVRGRRSQPAQEGESDSS